jgi:hypothetical protein
MTRMYFVLDYSMKAKIVQERRSDSRDSEPSVTMIDMLVVQY